MYDGWFGVLGCGEKEGSEQSNETKLKKRRSGNTLHSVRRICSWAWLGLACLSLHPSTHSFIPFFFFQINSHQPATKVISLANVKTQASLNGRDASFEPILQQSSRLCCIGTKVSFSETIVHVLFFFLTKTVLSVERKHWPFPNVHH